MDRPERVPEPRPVVAESSSSRQPEPRAIHRTAGGSHRAAFHPGADPRVASQRRPIAPAGCTIGGFVMLEDGKVRSARARAMEPATKIAAHLPVNSAKLPTPPYREGGDGPSARQVCRARPGWVRSSIVFR